jgi:hypothetical protein
VTGIVDRLSRALVARDADALARCFAADGTLTLRSIEHTWAGPDQIQNAAVGLFSAFPDLT